MATTYAIYAIDLVPVDASGPSADKRDWRTLLSTEPPERFLGFGAPVLAPLGGTVVNVHDGEPDHDARRSQLALVPYMLGQAERLRRGAAGLAGNHVVLELAQGRGYVALAHLPCVGSVHLQVMDGADPMAALGVPIDFTRSASITMAPSMWLRPACQQRAPSPSQRICGVCNHRHCAPAVRRRCSDG